MKKVLVFSHEYPPCLGGAGTVAELLFNYFSSNVEEYDVTLLTSSRSQVISSFDSKVVATQGNPKLWPVCYRSWIKKYISKFDLIICNDSVSMYNAARYFNKEEMLKTVCIVHGEEKFLEEGLYPKLIGFKRYYKKALYSSKKVVFVSAFIKSTYSNKYNIDLNNSVVIHSGVSDNFINLVKHEPINQFSFVTVGRIEKNKGFDCMFEVLKTLIDSNKSVQWNIVGDGGYFHEFEKLVVQTKYKDNINFLGKKSRDELPGIYNSHKYCISLSELNESYGLVFLEAASCGVIPIGYNRCGTKEAFSYIESGILVDDYKDPIKIANFLLKEMYLMDKSQAKCYRNQTDFILEFIDNVV